MLDPTDPTAVNATTGELTSEQLGRELKFKPLGRDFVEVFELLNDGTLLVTVVNPEDEPDDRRRDPEQG